VWLAGGRAGGKPKFRSEAALDESPQRLTKFRSPLLGRDKQIVWKINGGLHAGKYIPVFMACQNPANQSVSSAFSG
jgi:hypothetical protein